MRRQSDVAIADLRSCEREDAVVTTMMMMIFGASGDDVGKNCAEPPRGVRCRRKRGQSNEEIDDLACRKIPAVVIIIITVAEACDAADRRTERADRLRRVRELRDVQECWKDLLVVGELCA